MTDTEIQWSIGELLTSKLTNRDSQNGSMLTEFVALGLFVDFLGAVLIVEPDLPPRKRAFLHKYTPIIRKYRKIRMKFSKMDQDKIDSGENIDEFENLAKRVWPALREYHEWQIWKTYPEGSVDRWNSVSFNIEERGLVEDTDIRDRPFRRTTDSMENLIDDYIERWYRTKGWYLLITGFLIQLSATAIPLFLPKIGNQISILMPW